MPPIPKPIIDIKIPTWSPDKANIWLTPVFENISLVSSSINSFSPINIEFKNSDLSLYK